MKRLYKLYTLIFTGLVLSAATSSLAQDVMSATDVPTSLCANESLTMRWTSSIPFSGSVSIELSDASGSFVSPTVLAIETASAESEGYSYITIPASTALSPTSTYRIRAYNAAFAIQNSNDIVVNCTTRDYYWLGGSGNWSDLTKWEWTTDDLTYTAATELPTTHDNVIFDDTTFPSGGRINLDVLAYCNDFYWDPISAANNPNIWTDQWNNRLEISGDFELSDGVYYDVRNTYFYTDKYNIYVDFADNLYQKNTNDTWWKKRVFFNNNYSRDLWSDLDVEYMQISSGDFYTNDFNITSDLSVYISTNNFDGGTSTFNTGGLTVYGNSIMGGTTIFIHKDIYGNDPHINGSAIYNNVTIEDATCNIGSDNSFNDLTLINGGGLNLNGNTIQAVNGQLTIQGVDRSAMAIIKSQQPGTSATIALYGTLVDADYVSITDNSIDDGAFGTYIVTNAVDGGGNTNWSFSSPLAPLEYYWTGGAGNWSDVAHWTTSLDGGTTTTPASEGPGPIDNVNFNSSSFPSGGRLTIDQEIFINDLIWQPGSGVNNPEIYSDYDNKVTIYGDITFDNDVDRSISQLFIDSSKGGNTLTFADVNGPQNGNINLRGGGVINLNSDLLSYSWLNINDVTFNTNNFNLQFDGYEIYNSNTIINYGSSNITLGYYWYQDPSATVDYGTSNIIAYRPNNYPSEVYGNTSFYNFVAQGLVYFYENNSFNSLTVEAGGKIQIQDSRTLTVTSALNLSGSRSSFATIDVYNGSQGYFDVTGATVTADFANISNNTISPIATATSGVDGGNNTGWTIGPIPALDFYWIGGTGNWSDTDHWATTDGGSTLHGFLPGIIDNVKFTSNSFPSGGTITIDQEVSINDMTWQPGSGSTNPEIFGNWGYRFTIFGNLIMDNGVSRRINELAINSSIGINNVDLADNYNTYGDLRFHGGGTSELISDAIIGNYLVVEDATLNTNDNTIQSYGYNFEGNSGTLNLGNSAVTIVNSFNDWSGSGGTLNAGTSTIYFDNPGNTSYIQGNSSFSFNNVVFTNTVEVRTNNSYNSLTASAGSTIRLFAGSTQTINPGGTLTITGTSSAFVTIESYDYGTPGNGLFEATGATVNVDYANLSNNTINPASTANNSIDGGNLTGWTITAPPAQDYYWINGTGNWSELAHWQTSPDGGATFVAATSLPGAVDNIFFTSASFPATNGRLEIDQSVTINDMTWEAGSGTNTPEIYGNYDNWFTIRGDLTMDNSIIRNIYRLVFDSGSGQNNINMADNYQSYGDIFLRGDGIWNLTGDLEARGSFVVENGGTLETNDFSLGCSTCRFDSDLATYNLGNSAINIWGNFYNSYSITLNGTPTFYFGDGNGNNIDIYNSTSFYNVEINNPVYVYEDNSYVSLSVNEGGIFKIFANTTQSVSSSLNLNGSRSALATIESFDYGTPANGIFDVTGATVSADFVAISDNTISPASSATNAVDNGNNVGWTLDPLTPLNFYWINGTGNWSDLTHWKTSDDGGTTLVDATVAPGDVDYVFFNTNSFPSGGIITLDQPVTITNITWEAGSGVTNPQMYADHSNRLTIKGNLTMDDGVFRDIREMTFDSNNGSNLIYMADNYSEYDDYASGNIRFEGDGTWELQGDLYTNWSLRFEDGTLNTNDYTIKAESLWADNNLAVLNFGNSDIYITYAFRSYNGAAYNMGTSTMYFDNNWNGNTDISGDPITFYNVVINLQTEIQDDNFTFNTLTVNPGGNLRLLAGTTHTVTGALNLVGSRSSLANLESYDYGTPGIGTLVVTGATVNADFVNISDNTIDNGDPGTDVPATNAIDGMGNTGWALSPIVAIDFRWIGGTGNWSDMAHWEESTDDGATWAAATTAPGAVDNVFFTTNSFTEIGQVTVDQPITINDMIWESGSGTVGPTIYSNWENIVTIRGNLTMDNGVNRNFERLYIDSSIGTNTIDMADFSETWGNIYFTGDGTTELASDLSTWRFNVEDAIVNSNDYTLTIGYLRLDHDHPTLNLGNSIVNIDYQISDYSNIGTLNAGSSTINIERSYSEGISYIRGNPMTFNNVVTTGTTRIDGDNAYNSLAVNPGGTLQLFAGSTQTINNAGTLNLVGTRSGLVDIESFDYGTPGVGSFVVTGATVTADFVSIKDNTIDNGLAGNVLATNAIDLGGNTGWDYTPIASLDYYWIGGEGVWSDIAHWQTIDNIVGVDTTFIAATDPPGAVDNVFFTNNSFPNGGQLTIEETVHCYNMTWNPGSGANFPVIYADWPNFLFIHGSLQMANGVARNISRINFDTEDTGNTISFADNLYGWGDIDFAGNGDWTLLDSMAIDYLNIRGGTLNTNDQSISVRGQIYLDWQNTGTVNWSGSNVYLQGLYNNAQNLTFNAETSNFIFNESWQFPYLGGYSTNFNKVTATDKLRIENSSNYNELIISEGAELNLQSGSTQVINTTFTANGSRGGMIQIYSSEAGNPANLITTGAAVNFGYAIIQDNIIDNGVGTDEVANFSVDNGGNTGWDFLSNPLPPLEYYWIGGTGNWSDYETHWRTSSDAGTTLDASFSPPGVIDNVYFNTNSFPSGGTITLDQSAGCNNMTWTDGSFQPTITDQNGSILTIRGNLTIANGVNRSLSIIEFNSGDAGNLISLGDNRGGGYGDFSFKGGGEWSLLDSMAASSINIYSGSFSTLNNPVILTWDLNIHNDGAINLNFGSSELQASNINNWNWSNNVTADMGTSHMRILDNGRFWGNSMEFYDLTIEGWCYVGLDGTQSLTVSNTLTIEPGGTLEISPYMESVIAEHLVAVGTRPSPANILSSEEGMQATLSVPAIGTVTASDIVVKDNNAIGGALFLATESIDKGNNTGWSFTPITPIDFYWVGGSGNWSDIAHWETSDDNGSTFVPATFAPGAVDNVTVDGLKTVAGSMNIDIQAECTDMDWSLAPSGSSLTQEYDVQLTVHGSLTMATGVSNNLDYLIFDSDASGNTIDMADNAGNQYINMEFNGNGDWTLAGALSTFYLHHNSGTINTGGFDLSTDYLGMDGTGTLNLGSSDVYLTTLEGDSTTATLNAGTSTIYMVDNGVIHNSWLLNDIVVDGEVYIYDANTIGDLIIEPGSILYLGAGDTLVMNSMDAEGDRPQPITIKSTVDGTQAAIQQASGVVLAQYLTLQDNNAFGGALFVAQNSINNGNVTGWTVNTTSSRDYYWVGGSGDWSDFTNHWANAAGGSPGYSPAPGPLDNVYFDGSSFPSGGTITLNFPVSIKSMDWTGSTTAVSISDEGVSDNSLTIGGSLTLANGVSRDFEELNFISNNSGNSINMADNLHTYNTAYFEGSGDWTLASNFEAYSLDLAGGTFNSNDYDVTSTELYLAYDNVSNWGASDIYTEDFSTLDLDNSSTFSAGTSTFHFANSTVEGGVRYNNVEVSDDTFIENSNIIINANVTGGTLWLNANQALSNLTLGGGSTISLKEGTTQTVNLSLSLNGTQSSPVAVNSIIEGESGFITVPASGTVSATYVHLRDNTASGGATFNTSNSSDFGNVNGWNGLLQGQTINFDAQNDVANSAFSVFANASSGLTVNYEIESGSATVSGNTITPSGPGLIGIRAIQSGDVTFGNAEPYTRYIHVDATSEPNELGDMKEAKVVLGQSSNSSSNQYYADNTLPITYQAAVNNTGAFAVANGTRVMIWNEIPTSFGTSADALLGHTDYGTDREDNPSASIFSRHVISVAFAGDKLIAADGHRVLIWNSLPTGTGTAADVVIGQTDFNSTKRGTSHVLYGKNQDADGTLAVTTWYDDVLSDYKLIVTDGANNRVLVYNGIPTSNGEPADLVIGQPDFTTSLSGNGADDMNFPVHTSVAGDGKLFIADYGNNRVLVFNDIRTLTNGASANMVLGQPGFGVSGEGVSAIRFGGPTGVSVSRSGRLAISEYDNNRVLVYNSIPSSSTVAPDYILGQPDATTNDINYNSLSGRTLSQPISADWDMSENLFVSDNLNNRVLFYGAPDNDGPVVDENGLPSVHDFNNGTAGSLTVTDRSPIDVTITYWGISKTSSNSEIIDHSNILSGTLNFNTNDLFQAGEEIGIDYQIEVTDYYGNSTPVDRKFLRIQRDSGLPITNFGVGSDSDDYRIFSVPLDLTSKDVNSVFNEITSGTYNPEEFRVYSYPGGASAAYTEYGDGLTNIVLGKGYFALSKTSASVNSGAGLTASVVDAFDIQLVPGWNLIGNPYNFSVSWADVLTASAIGGTQPSNPEGYTSGWAEQSAIAAGVGVFVNNPTSSNMTIRIPVQNNTGGRVEGIIANTNPISDETWEVRFLETNHKGSEMLIGAVGMDPYSIESFDEMDRINPPAFGEQPVVEFIHPEFFQPSFKTDYRATGFDQHWKFTYSAPAIDDERTIHWDNSYYGSTSPDIYLVDKSHFKVINMKEEASYSFEHGGVTEFEVFFGHNALEAIYPDRLVTITPYPNPFTDEVRINVGLPNIEATSEVNVVIFNTIGRQVATLRTHANNNAYMEFLWRGTNDSGAEVPDGVYAFKVLVDGEISEFVTGKVIKH